MQIAEYTSALLDHRERLRLWARTAWIICGQLYTKDAEVAPGGAE